MRILILDPIPFFDFASLGHQETRVSLTRFETPLEEILAGLANPPDCIIQMESLGTRRFVSGLEKAPCPTVFYSFDTHLNLFWQRYYARLFDAVATPHVSWFENLPETERPRRVFRLPHAGTPVPWKPHGNRGHSFGFCGRRTSERPLREWMLESLARNIPLAIRENLAFADMMLFYGDARVVPNEAICFEVNCRLFEAASSGAVPLTPDCGPDQTAVFTPGAEMLVYEGGIDLLKKARWLAANPEKAEAIGRTAWERVQREHLPAHRAKTLLETLPRLGRERAAGDKASLLLWLTCIERMKAGDMGHSLSFLLAQGASLPQTPEMFAGLLNLLAPPSRKDDALGLCRGLLEGNIAPESGLCNAAASAAALLHGDFPLSREFWLRFREHAPEETAALPSDTPFELCLAWAENEKREGRAVRPGFSFSSRKSLLPSCAFEFLVFAEEAGPPGKATEAKLSLLEKHPPYLPYRLGLLNALAPEPGDWRRLLEAASASLHCCLARQGEILYAKARAAAKANGEGSAFRIALAASSARAYSRLHLFNAAGGQENFCVNRH